MTEFTKIEGDRGDEDEEEVWIGISNAGFHILICWF
jgi:hypothetical protein